MLNHSRVLALSAVCACAAISSAQNIVKNGGFELSSVPTGTFVTKNAGNLTLDGWVIGGDSIDHVGTLGWAYEGTQSIDLNGTQTYFNSAGSVAQMLATTIGQEYKVSWRMAGNPQGAPDTKSVEVFFGGVSRGVFTSPNSLSWGLQTFSVFATGANSELKFVSLDPTPYGALLDDVSVEAVPEPATMSALVLMGIAALRKRR